MRAAPYNPDAVAWLRQTGISYWKTKTFFPPRGGEGVFALAILTGELGQVVTDFSAWTG